MRCLVLAPVCFFTDDRAIGAGSELTIADQTANPSGWNGYLDVDMSGYLLTITHMEDATDYQTASITLTDILFDLVGEMIIDVTLITDSIIDFAGSAPYTEEILFTNNSIILNFFVNDIPGQDIFNFIDGGTATYQITTRTVSVNAPASLGLMFLGLAGFALRRRFVK
ncbi:MAG: PEP-CTERM sorting domain-containing protein [Emcibacter sp.]|nr:PEP-CTERM sorting domain-containing protein [Emcibacter sp.]